MIDVDQCKDLDALRHEIKALRHQLSQRDTKLRRQRTDIGRLGQKCEALTKESIERRRIIEQLQAEAQNRDGLRRSIHEHMTASREIRA